MTTARSIQILLGFSALFVSSPTWASTYSVSPGPGNSADDLRQAIIDANNHSGADTVELAAGVYRLQQSGRGEDWAATGDLDIRDDVTIQGAGLDATIIDGDDLDRIFHVISGNHTVTISDLTISNATPGTSSDQVGGCLRNDGGTVNLLRTRVVDGLARQGGGVYSEGGDLVIRDSVISSNRASAGTSGQGGGIFFRETSNKKLQIINSIVSDNQATDDGGGIENYEGTVEIYGSTISGNTSGDDGGGIENDNHNSGGFLDVRDSAFINNSAVNSGGIDNDGFLTMVNVTLSGNRATGTAKEAWGSGAIRNSEDTASGITVALTNCTIYGNLAVVDSSLIPRPADVSNISRTTANVRMKNTILGTCLSHVEAGQQGTFVSLGNNVIEDSSGCQLSLEPGASPDIAGDPKVDTLSDGGTAGYAHLPLLPDSPAIDAADAGVAPATDQIGQGRVDGNGDSAVAPDIGAIELQGLTFDSWCGLHFSSAELQKPDISGESADPDSDAKDNFFEYVLGSDPRTADHTADEFKPAFVDDSGEDYLSLQVTRNPLATDLIFEVDASGNLLATNQWSSAEVTTLIDLPALLKVRDNTPFSSTADMRFLRLTVRKE